MVFIENLQKRLHDYYLDKELKGHRMSHRSVDFNQAKSIGILFDGTDLNERQVVTNFSKSLQKSGKKVKLLAYMQGDQKHGDFPFKHFNKTDLDFALRPLKSEAASEFIKTNFDILINLSPTTNLPLEYISALSHAKFRVGAYTEKTYCYELIIEPPANKDLNSFINQVTFFLNKMKATHEATAA